MDQHFQFYIATYGYIAIFVFLFFGIVGIPAPEESMMIFVGIAISQGTLHFLPVLTAAFLGVITGMFTAYTIGYIIGKPILYKLGKFLGMSQKKWDKATTTFKKHALWSVAVGFYLPGVRQVNPYMAGISRTKIPFYIGSTIVGALAWTTTFLLVGYFVGNRLERFMTLTPLHIGIGLSFFLLLFAVFVTVHIILFKRQTD